MTEQEFNHAINRRRCRLSKKDKDREPKLIRDYYIIEEISLDHKILHRLKCLTGESKHVTRYEVSGLEFTQGQIKDIVKDSLKNHKLLHEVVKDIIAEHYGWTKGRKASRKAG